MSKSRRERRRIEKLRKKRIQKLQRFWVANKNKFYVVGGATLVAATLVAIDEEANGVPEGYHVWYDAPYTYREYPYVYPYAYQAPRYTYSHRKG